MHLLFVRTALIWMVTTWIAGDLFTVTGAEAQPMKSYYAKMTCAVTQSERELEILYTVSNAGEDDLYLLDILPVQVQQKIEIAVRPIHLSHSGDGIVRMLQGIAPLPEDREVAVRSIPLATRILPDKKIERKIILPIPLREQGPYDPAQKASADRALNVDQFEVVLHYLPGAKLKSQEKIDIKKLILQIPSQELYRVSTSHTAGDAIQMDCKLKLKAIPLWKQGSEFKR